MRIFEESKEKEMQGLRSAGLSLAHADRAAQGRRSGGTVIAVAGGVGVMLVGVIATLVLQMEPAAQPTQLTVAPQPQAIETIIAPPAPATMAVAEQEFTEPENELTAAIKRAMAQDVDSPAQESTVQEAPEQTTTLNFAPDPVLPQAGAAPVATSDCVTRLDTYLAPLFVQFDLGSTVITPENAELLSRISDKIITCEDAYVMVAGHADTSGDDATNMALSWERADRTLNRLVALGVNPDAVEAVGFGARAPLSQGSSEEDGVDRRVDFRVLRLRRDQ